MTSKTQQAQSTELFETWGFIRAIAEEIKEQAEPEEATAKYCMECFQVYVNMYTPGDGSIVTDMLNKVISEVDWDYIAERVNETISEND